MAGKSVHPAAQAPPPQGGDRHDAKENNGGASQQGASAKPPLQVKASAMLEVYNTLHRLVGLARALNSFVHWNRYRCTPLPLQTSPPPHHTTDYLWSVMLCLKVPVRKHEG